MKAKTTSAVKTVLSPTTVQAAAYALILAGVLELLTLLLLTAASPRFVTEAGSLPVQTASLVFATRVRTLKELTCAMGMMIAFLAELAAS